MADVPSDVRDRRGWLDLKLVDNQGADLSQWDIDFVDSLHGWLRAGRMLTPAQRARLDRLIEEKVR